MGLEADFVTGRAILSGEPAVAVIVVSRARPGREHTNTQAAVYPHDQFMPLSYMLDGTVDDDGFFVPKGQQLALEVLMKTLKVMTWADARAMLNSREPVVLEDHPVVGKNIVSPGIAIMHKSTAEAVSKHSFVDYDLARDVETAATILNDAHRQLNDGNRLSYFVATGDHVSSPYETFGGVLIDVPEVSNAFSGDFSSPAYALKRAMGSFFKEAGSGSHQQAVALFEMLSRYQVFLAGLHVLGKKLEPSPFARHDNTLEATKFNLNEVLAAVSAIPSKPYFGPDYEDEYSEPLEAIAAQLKMALSKVEDSLVVLSARAPRR